MRASSEGFSRSYSPDLFVDVELLGLGRGFFALPFEGKEGVGLLGDAVVDAVDSREGYDGKPAVAVALHPVEHERVK